MASKHHIPYSRGSDGRIMGRQSSRLMNMEKDHKDIFFNGYYHKQMWITDENANPTLVWEKLKEENAFSFTVRDTMVSYFDDGWSPTAGTIRITISSSEYLTIDWGDGTKEKTKGSSNIYYGITHTYPTSDGTLYTVNVYGNVEYFYPTIQMQSSYNSCVEEILTPFPLTLCEGIGYAFAAWFAYCKAIKKIPENLLSACSDYDEAVAINGMFMYSGLTEAPANVFFGINKISGIPFQNCPELYTVSPLVFNGTGGYMLDSAFYNCVSLLHAPGEIFSLFNGTTATNTFSGCKALLSVSSISNSSLETLQSTFNGCTALETVSDISISTLKAMASTFYGCYSLKTVGEIICKSLETMQNTFYNCTSLVEAPIIESEALESMVNTFYGCTSLEKAQNINSKTLKTMTATFQGCESLTELPSINCENLESMQNVFMGCASITSIPSDFLDNCPNVTDVRNLFRNCKGITGKVPELWEITSITSYRGCFYGCTNAENYNDIPTAWK